MEINEAISTLQTLSQNLGAEKDKLSTQQTAVDIAVAQLQGLLTADLAELEQAKTDISSLLAQNTSLQDQITSMTPDTPV